MKIFANRRYAPIAAVILLVEGFLLAKIGLVTGTKSLIAVAVIAVGYAVYWGSTQVFDE